MKTNSMQKTRTTTDEMLSFRTPPGIDIQTEAQKRGMTRAKLARIALLHFLGVDLDQECA